MNIALLLDVAASMDPDRLIVTDGSGSMSLEQLRNAALTLAAQLAELRAEGPLAFVDINSTRFPVGLFGAAYAGRAFAPLNYRADTALMSHFFAMLRPAAVLGGERYRAVIPSDFALFQLSLPLSGAEPPSAWVDDDGVAVHLFTSGTASTPKAVLLRHRQLAAYVLNSVEPLQEPPESASLIVAPNYHVAAIANVLTSTYSGRRMVLLDEFAPDRWLELARRESVTHAFVVPTMLHRIVEHLRGKPADLPDLHTLAYGGAPTDRPTVEAALHAFPSTGLVNAYGLTETCSTVSVLGPAEHRAALESGDPQVRSRLSSAGRPLPAIEVRIASDGEVLVRGEQVSGEYANSASQVDAAGWFHTGDLGRVDADGYLYLLGRRDDTIIRGSENISPLEVEEVLRLCPGVRDVGVVGVADAEWGQRLVAAIETDKLDEQTLIEWVRIHLPSFKRPSSYVRFDRLPRNELGKVLRRVIRQDIEQRV